MILGEGNGRKPVACAWCGKGHTRVGRNKQDYTACCTKICDKKFAEHGFGASRLLIDARRAHVASQPKGCKTVEEFLAAGGTVYKEHDFVGAEA